MATATADHDVFRLVSLRTSMDGLTIEPSTDGVAMPVNRELSGADLRHPSVEMLRMATSWKPLSLDELLIVVAEGARRWARTGRRPSDR